MSNNASNIVSIQAAFDTAIEFAKFTFMKELSFQLKNSNSSELGTGISPTSDQSILYTTTSSNFLSKMFNILGNYHDAWILTLAHEKGHILLNQICSRKGRTPKTLTTN